MFNLFQPKVPQVDAAEVNKAIASHKDVVLLDVRTPEEYKEGHIRKSTLIPLQTLQQNISKLTDKSKTMYVYCRSGSRSAYAVRLLQKLGYTNVFNMSGGVLSWRAKGFDLQRD